MIKRSFLQGFLFLALAQTMVGINIVISKVLLSSLPVLLVLEIRFLLATFVLFPLHWTTAAREKSLKAHFSDLKRKDWLFILAQALSAGVLFNCLMLAGLNDTDANVAGIITSALPALIALMSWLILREKISAQKITCVAFASLGLVIIAYDKLKGVDASHSILGDALVLLSLLPEAAYYIFCKMYAIRLPLFLTSSLLNGINALLLLPALFMLNGSASLIHASTWVMLLVIGLSSGLFYVFWSVGARHVDGVMASLTTGIMPIATVLLAWLILHEGLSSTELIGMGFVMLSILVYTRQ